MKVGSVLGHYHVVRTLGRGGMGAVYEANDTRLNRQVALKVLPARMAGNPEWFKRFEREAQAVAALNHPNIVTIHSVEEADDVHFIILELVGGKTLEELIPEDGLSLDGFFDIAIPLTDAIAAAHKRGIAHRDLKPSNVMVDEEGRVKVLDFGIAKLTEEVPDDEAATQVGSEALTEEGKIVGTVAYMSPEQAEGKTADSRSDIFSLGIILYEMATGDRPFVGDTKLSIMASIVKDDPPTIIERNLQMPRHLARIVKKALEKDLARRYQSMVELRNDLVELKEEIDAGEVLVTGGSLTDPGTIDAYRAPPKASPWGKWIGIGGIAAAAAAGAWMFFGAGSEPVIIDTELTQLTTTSGVEYGGTISPDGEWFAYARQDENDSWLVLQSVGSRTEIPLGRGASPAFSPDGGRLAFSEPAASNQAQAFGGGISVMGRTGDNVQRLTDFGFNPAWSPDGTKIVFVNEFVSSRPYSRSPLGGGLFILDLEGGGDPIPLEGVTDSVQPAWSPNGHRIAYWANHGGIRDIWTYPADGEGEEVRVTDDEAVDFSPVWAPDGRWLYFASTRSGSMAIWRVPIDEVSGAVTGEPQPVTTGGTGEPGMLSISADGSRLVYTETLTTGSIAEAEFDAETLTITSVPTPVARGSRRLLQPDVSPDGDRLVYRTEGAQQDLFVKEIAGTTESQVTNDLAKEWAPRWSPDGQQILFYSNTSGDYDVWTINPDGSRATRHTDTGRDLTPVEPVWSPDGATISYYITDTGGFLIDATKTFENQEEESLPPVPLADDQVGAFRPRDWTDDGERIVGFVDTEPEQVAQTLAIYVYDRASGEYDYIAEGTAPFWMADQRRVVGQVPGSSSFFVVDSVTKDRWQLVIPAETGVAVEGITLSPANDKIYINRWEAESDIWMIEIRQR